MSAPESAHFVVLEHQPTCSLSEDAIGDSRVVLTAVGRQCDPCRDGCSFVCLPSKQSWDQHNSAKDTTSSSGSRAVPVENSGNCLKMTHDPLKTHDTCTRWLDRKSSQRTMKIKITSQILLLLAHCSVEALSKARLDQDHKACPSMFFVDVIACDCGPQQIFQHSRALQKMLDNFFQHEISNLRIFCKMLLNNFLCAQFRTPQGFSTNHLRFSGGFS